MSSDVVRAEQKDEFYADILRIETYRVAENVLGSRRTHRWNAEILLLADVVFYLLVLLSRGRTLGEEFAELVSINRAGAPQVGWRKFAALSSRFMPLYVLKKYKPHYIPHYDLVLSAHAALFYLTGGPKVLMRRLLRIDQIQIKKRPQPETNVFFYLGCAMFARVAVSLLKMWTTSSNADAALKHVERQGSADLANAEDQGKSPKCLICMSAADVPTLTTCGHLFCWECITTWLQAHSSCAICRSPSLPQHLLPIRHYLPSP
eukprot:GEMP01054801.1.p1 GENE.GEMP01054801.1~~GEMP01054801.1.p1  ORF type:complete len:270 (+),score=46.47 GEMP01054801.1:26-811(+)